MIKLWHCIISELWSVKLWNISFLIKQPQIFDPLHDITKRLAVHITMAENNNSNCYVKSDDNLFLYRSVNYFTECSSDHSISKNVITTDIAVLPHCFKPEVSKSELTGQANVTMFAFAILHTISLEWFHVWITWKYKIINYIV